MAYLRQAVPTRPVPRCWIFFLLAALLAGCATFVPIPAEPDRRTLSLVDRAVARAGAGDAAYARVPGFPYLRVNRFLAAAGEEIAPRTGSPPFSNRDLGGFFGGESIQTVNLEEKTDDGALARAEIPPGPPLEKGGETKSPPFSKGDLGGFWGNEPPSGTWLQALRQLDREARAREIANLPKTTLIALGERLGIAAGRGTLLTAAIRAGDRLLEKEGNDPGTFARIVQNAKVPSEYSLFLRTAGVYPLTVLPVAWVTHRVNQRFAGWRQKPETAPALRGERVVFGPGNSERMSAPEMARLFAPENRDPLGRPVLTEAEEASLFRHFAPVFAVDVAAAYDRPGKVVWNGPAAAVDPRFPTGRPWILGFQPSTPTGPTGFFGGKRRRGSTTCSGFPPGTVPFPRRTNAAIWTD